MARQIGYPVIIKAALGGGGKGMRTALSSRRTLNRHFTDSPEGISDGTLAMDTMYIEHFVEHPRHIEFQILADSYGNVSPPGRTGLLHPAKSSEDD